MKLFFTFVILDLIVYMYAFKHRSVIVIISRYKNKITNDLGIQRIYGKHI